MSGSSLALIQSRMPVRMRSTTVLIVMDCVVAFAVVCYLAAARLIASDRPAQ